MIRSSLESKLYISQTGRRSTPLIQLPPKPAEALPVLERYFWLS